MHKPRTEAQKELNRQACARWRAAHPGRAKAVRDAYVGRNPDVYWARDIRELGMTKAAYYSMLDAQDGRCAICNNPPSDNKRLSVDHCHSTKVIRGLLCQPCNVSLGLMKDSPANLRAAADYLERV